ncbi:caspase family protein [Nostoc sp. CHAB 5784]|uniref:caspase family protein n=1 Tax=Nostoc mirabile TaxID=2907820 RepID=UPI001E488ECA|nr:caspase family protein [Nostoc mirabile]MCC5669624.1 caspase family protein [Nostoc mirabile CHAB5784]
MSNLKNNFAVVIGINQYENNIPELKTAVNNAKQIAKILENEHKYQVLLLTEKQATYIELRNLLASLQQQILPLSDGKKIQLDKDDRLLFYFAGHGIGLNADDGVERPEGLLVPQDANLNENKNLLSMQLLHDTLVSLHSRHLLIIFDCCFAGSFRWTGKSRHARPKRQIVRERYERYLKGNAKQVITSTAHDEKATDQSRFGKRDEIEINGHSPFAQLLLDGLKGQADLTQDGVITTYELYSYLQSELVNNPTPTKQTPLVFTLAGHDIGDYIFWLASFDLDKLPKAIALDKNTNPYRGLKSFEKENEELFFGRNQLIKNLAEIVETHPLTVVLGSSGSGKSSLVKAGLVPYLEKPENVTHPWNILLPLRLGNSPFKALDNLLKKRQGLPLTQLTQPPQPPQQKILQAGAMIALSVKKTIKIWVG